MDSQASVATLALRVVALALAAATIVLIALGNRTVDLLAILLSIGLFALAVSAIIEGRVRRREQQPFISPRPPRPTGKQRKRRR